MTRSRQPNLLKKLERALENATTLNRNRHDNEYQYWLDTGVILRCLIADHTDDEVLASLNAHGYNAASYGPALRFLRNVADSTAAD